jgi:hypothetical protein
VDNKANRYTKVMLTMLTLGVWGLLLRPLLDSAPAEAQGNFREVPFGNLKGNQVSAKSINAERVKVDQLNADQVSAKQWTISQISTDALKANSLTSNLISTPVINALTHDRKGRLTVNIIDAGSIRATDGISTNAIGSGTISATSYLSTPYVSSRTFELNNPDGTRVLLTLIGGKLVLRTLDKSGKPSASVPDRLIALQSLPK